MKSELLTVIVCSALVISFAYLFFFNDQSKSGLTGLSIFNDSSSFINQDNISNSSIIYTKQNAIDAIKEAESILFDMQLNNLPILFVNDTLIESIRIFQVVENGDILRNSSSSKKDKDRATDFLQFIEWQEVSYNSVIFQTEKIKLRKKQSLLLHDSIIATETSIKNLLKENPHLSLTKAQDLLDESKKSFEKDRLEESQALILEVRDELEFQRSQTTILSTLQKNTKNFFQRYWPYIILSTIIVLIIAVLFHKKISKIILKSRIQKMHAEKKTLITLMKKAQVERFKENKIPALVYNIRMKKYQERMNEIKVKLPILEKKLDIKSNIRKKKH